MKIVKLEEGHFGMTIYNKKIFISNSFIINIKDSTKLERNVTFLAGLLRRILHEIMNCLINYLPSLSKDYKGLCNPFISSYKKNIKVYNYVLGKVVYLGAKNSLEILQNKIENYKIIRDSGNHFESKLFEDNDKMNYFNSEYFLNVKNLNQPLKDFKANMIAFEAKINESYELKKLRDETSVIFKQYDDNTFYFGRCLLNPKKPFIMK